jgi:hypothetical protein
VPEAGPWEVTTPTCISARTIPLVWSAVKLRVRATRRMIIMLLNRFLLVNSNLSNSVGEFQLRECLQYKFALLSCRLDMR